MSRLGTKTLHNSIPAVVEPLIDLSALQAHACGQLSDFFRSPVRIELELSIQEALLLLRNSVLAHAKDTAFADLLAAAKTPGARWAHQEDGRDRNWLKIEGITHRLGTSHRLGFELRKL